MANYTVKKTFVIYIGIENLSFKNIILQTDGFVYMYMRSNYERVQGVVIYLLLIIALPVITCLYFKSENNYICCNGK